MTKKTTKKESKPKIPEIIVVGLKIVKAENFASENKMGKRVTNYFFCRGKLTC